MDSRIHSVIPQKVMHLAKILWEQSLFSKKFSFEWVYFWAGKPHGCSSIYIEKIVKNHLWEGMTILRGRCLATKINFNFFVGNKVLNIFHLTIFSKNLIIFQNNGGKYFLGRMTIFRK